MPRSKARQKVDASPPRERLQFEAEVVEGLSAFGADELANVLGLNQKEMQVGGEYIRFAYAGDWKFFWRLKMIESIALVQDYSVPRPRALLGDAHFRRLLAQITTIQEQSLDKRLVTFNIAAAGSDSSVMHRIRDEIAARTGLLPAEEGDLRVRIVPGGAGWETIMRISPRPYSARAWRVCNFEASLNATVAHVMTTLMHPTSQDCMVNLGCGSGALLIERAAWGGFGMLIGIDSNAEVLVCARQNSTASGARVNLLQGRMERLSLSDACVDSLCADLPFGQNSGSPKENERLYPALVSEAGRIAKPGARFVVITHAIRLIEQVIENTSAWQIDETYKITLRGLHPCIYVLIRR